MNDCQISEICKAFVYGETIERISEVEGYSVDEVKQVLTDNAELIQELKQFYKTMGVEV